ncbi:MAG TPA: SRPBCC family protein [Woeseiaceae bacterium]|nr:SRPBCC family protein [Woeseiaceae bacterium]
MQKLIYGTGALLALLIVIGFALPRTHRVEVSIEIDAHQATVFALVNDLRRFSDWSPWTDTDPNARVLFSGPPRGEGAVMTWDGAIIGSGSQLITESVPYKHIGLLMNPGESGEARAWFDFAPGAGTTIVHWGFETDYGLNIVGRYFASMLGGIVARDFHNGLLRLKDLAEGLPSADFSDIEIEHIVVEAMQIAYLPATSRSDPAAISEALGKAYFQILSFIDRNKLSDAGAPLSIMRSFTGSELRFDAAIPIRGVNDDTPRESNGVRIGQTYAGPVVRVRHTGSYRGLTGTHRKISAYLAAFDIARNGAAWESYVSDPGKVAEADLLTYVYYPIKPE